jgi:signal transduction histidine kinase
MDIVIAAVAALVIGWLLGSRRTPPEQPDRYAPALTRFAADLSEGRPGEPRPDEPPPVGVVRQAVVNRWVPRSEKQEEALRQAFGRVAAFLQNSVETPLRRVREGDAEFLREGIDRALGGLKDMEFYLREPLTPDETHNLTPLLQQVTREFIEDWETAVRVMAPSTPVRAHIHRDTFLDAVYLLLHNAGHFGDGQTVDIRVEEEGDEARVVIRDRGPGFTDEALERARDLFYTTREGALGLGIPFSRKVLEGFGGRLAIRNHPDGGAEVTMVLPAAS